MDGKDLVALDSLVDLAMNQMEEKKKIPFNRFLIY